MIGIKQKYQDLFFQTEQTVNRKKSGFRASPNGTVFIQEKVFCALIYRVVREKLVRFRYKTDLNSSFVINIIIM